MKINSKRRHPMHFTDTKRNPCVRVQMAKKAGHAIVDAEAYAELMQAQVSPNWALNSNGQGRHYVKAGTINNKRVVARLITKAAAGEQVEYRNGNPLDLRRDNLRLVRGGHATVDCAALLEPNAGEQG